MCAYLHDRFEQALEQARIANQAVWHLRKAQHFAGESRVSREYTEACDRLRRANRLVDRCADAALRGV